MGQTQWGSHIDPCDDDSPVLSQGWLQKGIEQTGKYIRDDGTQDFYW